MIDYEKRRAKRWAGPGIGFGAGARFRGFFMSVRGPRADMND